MWPLHSGVAWLCWPSAGCLCSKISWSLVHQTDLEALQRFKPLWSVHAQVVQPSFLPFAVPWIQNLLRSATSSWPSRRRSSARTTSTVSTLSTNCFHQTGPKTSVIWKRQKLFEESQRCFLSSVEYLSNVGRAVFQGLASDKEAVWLMQGWLFMFDQVILVNLLGFKVDSWRFLGILGHSSSGSTFDFSSKRTASCVGSWLYWQASTNNFT